MHSLRTIAPVIVLMQQKMHGTAAWHGLASTSKSSDVPFVDILTGLKADDSKSS
jgi:hypothetical protein